MPTFSIPQGWLRNARKRLPRPPAVEIEPGLRQQSPENRSFSSVRQRLSAVSLGECRKSEPGDCRLIRKSPPLAGLSASISAISSERRTAWLGREDSNLRMVESKSGYSTNDFNACILKKIGNSSLDVSVA